MIWKSISFWNFRVYVFTLLVLFLFIMLFSDCIVMRLALISKSSHGRCSGHSESLKWVQAYHYQQPFWVTFTNGPQMSFYFLMIHTQTFWCFPWVTMKVLQSSVPKNMDRFTHIYTPNSFPMYSEHVRLGERSAPLPRSHQPDSPARERKHPPWSAPAESVHITRSELHTSMSN